MNFFLLFVILDKGCDSGGGVKATQENDNVDLIIPNSKLHLQMKN